MEIRNIAIIAHVDHGKTTLTNAMLHQTQSATADVNMDSNALELERGITIYSKNAAIRYKDTKINIVDTPGHSDFGSEVERVLRSIDSVLLVVDAQEGPMPQTRFVLKKSLALGLKPILVINKIDKPAADPQRTHDQVFELFMELGATDEQLNFHTVYTIGKTGSATTDLKRQGTNIFPLLDAVLQFVPPATSEDNDVFRAQPFNLGYDNYLGRLAIIRVYHGSISKGDTVYVLKQDGSKEKGKITNLFTFSGILRKEALSVSTGDIAIIAGIPGIYIGDTISTDPVAQLLDAIAVDEPTIKLNLLVNDSPFAGRDGKFVTSRQLCERLLRELEVNVGLRVDFNVDSSESFIVSGRGELHIAILLENMRREGFELQVSQPEVILKEINGIKSEPFEEIIADVPTEYQGAVIEQLGKRGSIMQNIEIHGDRALLSFEGPSRGFFGYRNAFVIDTKGEGILSTRTIGYRPYAGDIQRAESGSMISQTNGKTLAYALDNLQTRGALYIKENTEVYEGMIIGNTTKGEQMTVNPTKGKQLTNMRAAGSDDAIKLTPPKLLSIERGLEIMSGDEYLEITPKNVRLRKQQLRKTDRNKARV